MLSELTGIRVVSFLIHFRVFHIHFHFIHFQSIPQNQKSFSSHENSCKTKRRRRQQVKIITSQGILVNPRYSPLFTLVPCGWNVCLWANCWSYCHLVDIVHISYVNFTITSTYVGTIDLNKPMAIENVSMNIIQSYKPASHSCYPFFIVSRKVS